MTETALNEKLAELPGNESVKERQKLINRRKMRRTAEIKKNNDLLRIINYGGYAPHRGYIATERLSCIQESTSSIPRTVIVKSGSREKPAGGSETAKRCRRRVISTVGFSTIGGLYTERMTSNNIKGTSLLSLAILRGFANYMRSPTGVSEKPLSLRLMLPVRVDPSAVDEMRKNVFCRVAVETENLRR